MHLTKAASAGGTAAKCDFHRKQAYTTQAGRFTGDPAERKRAMRQFHSIMCYLRECVIPGFYAIVQTLLAEWLLEEHPQFHSYWYASTWVEKPADRIRFGVGQVLTGNFYEYLHGLMKM